MNNVISKIALAEYSTLGKKSTGSKSKPSLKTLNYIVLWVCWWPLARSRCSLLQLKKGWVRKQDMNFTHGLLGVWKYSIMCYIKTATLRQHISKCLVFLWNMEQREHTVEMTPAYMLQEAFYYTFKITVQTCNTVKGLESYVCSLDLTPWLLHQLYEWSTVCSSSPSTFCIKIIKNWLLPTIPLAHFYPICSTCVTLKPSIPLYACHVVQCHSTVRQYKCDFLTHSCKHDTYERDRRGVRLGWGCITAHLIILNTEH